MTVLGQLSLWLAFLVGLWGAVTGFAGGALKDRPDLQQSARHAVFVLCGALLIAVVSLEVAIFRHDFNVEYVAAYTSRNLPTFYLWSALYAGQKGSLLFWATVLSLFAALAQLFTARRHRAYLPYVAAVTCLVATFFVTVLLTIKSFNVFDLILLLTDGGPGQSTLVLSQYIYQKGFVENQFGYASAVSIVLFAICFGITVIQFLVNNRKDA